MTDIQKWIKYAFTCLKDQMEIAITHFEKGDMELMTEQTRILQRNLNTFMTLLERKQNESQRSQNQIH